MNVLYNNMRGGVFLEGYSYDPALFEHFLFTHNRGLAAAKADFLEKLRLSGNRSILYLHEQARVDGDPDLIRLSLEFLPLSFSRRHGDPSRPWNRFHIRLKDDNGNRLYHYEGNWRDIFQNWEAMCRSFPEYIAPVAVKFLNAATADGFNPYRITEDGVDWEIPEPDNPFSGYGYWGDHQIVYLNRLLEWLDAYAPDQLGRFQENEIFTYADAPYEIKPYAALIEDGKNTIAFNPQRHKAALKRVEANGCDGKLLTDGNGIYHAAFMEKILTPILAKLSNLVPNGGVWMNTQRPEWNDANNAIVGSGLSMVTVYQLYRHLIFCGNMVQRMAGPEFTLSNEVWQWMKDIESALAGRGTKTAREYLDEAGAAFERYRTRVYANGFSGKKAVGKDELKAFLDLSAEDLAGTIDANKRADGLYNAYNIMRLTPGDLTISPLFPMLEGQTAILASGRLTPDEALSLVEAMERSELYSRESQTFYLYPVKRLKTFMERNIIPPEDVRDSKLIKKLLSDGDETLVVKDSGGNVRFHEDIRQSADLEVALNRLYTDGAYAAELESDAGGICGTYERVFAHRQFTGRSGIMYKYEGIGCIYWHQNSKFLLSFQEVFSRAAEEAISSGGPISGLKPLKDAYYRLRAGFGFNKEPSQWGAFPLEPYSHTPLHMPAQQPGMTGQVKEDIITRMAELGVFVWDGILSFNPALLRRSEFFSQPSVFRYISMDGETRELPLGAGSLAFTVCRAPVVYRLSAHSKTRVLDEAGRLLYESGNLTLDGPVSRMLFSLDSRIGRIEVEFAEDSMA